MVSCRSRLARRLCRRKRVENSQDPSFSLSVALRPTILTVHYPMGVSLFVLNLLCTAGRRGSGYLQTRGAHCVFVLLVWTVLLCPSLRAVDSGIVRLETIPTTMKLGPGEKQRLMLVARNGSSERVEVLGLDWIAAVGISVVNQSGNNSLLTPGGGVSWLLEVARTNDSHETVQVHFRLDYKLRNSVSTSEVVNCAMASLEVQDRQQIQLEKVAEVRAESSLKLLQEPRTGTVYIVVKNMSDSALNLLSINPNIPSDLIVTNVPRDRQVAPRTVAVFPLDISAAKTVHSGKHLLLFEVNLAWNDEGHSQTGSALCKYECDVGVLGDSEFLVPVGVPSFLLLPGFLIVIVFSMLWGLFHKDKPFPWSAKTAEFWSLAIIISLLAITAYRLRGSNLLDGYGLKDVYLVWFGSATVGLVIWAVTEACFRLRLRVVEGRKRREIDEVQRRTFTSDDSPVEVLRKLALNKRGFQLDQVKVQVEGSTARGFLLQPQDGAHPTAWVAPAIVLVFDEELKDDRRAKLQKIFEAQVAQVGDADAMASLIEREKRNGVSAKWKPSATLRRVTQVTAVSPADGAPPASLLKLEP